MTIHHVHACLHKACKDAVRWGQLTRNPLDAADPTRKKGDGTREMRTWSAEQLGADLVFTRENGAALDPETVTRHFRQAVKKSMLPLLRLHDLKHTHATLARQAGIHPKVVSERLGHATISITLDTYSHVIPAM